MQQIGHVARRRTRRPSDADGRCVSSSRHGGPAARGLHGPLLFSAVAAHVFASVIHRPHRSAFGRCPSDLWLLRAIARSKLPALATSRLHIRTISTVLPSSTAWMGRGLKITKNTTSNQVAVTRAIRPYLSPLLFVHAVHVKRRLHSACGLKTFMWISRWCDLAHRRSVLSSSEQ